VAVVVQGQVIVHSGVIENEDNAKSHVHNLTINVSSLVVIDLIHMYYATLSLLQSQNQLDQTHSSRHYLYGTSGKYFPNKVS
jgi:hypothetical protein